MLKEFKKPMWNDGYAKDMPWLNYFNEYERTHCCFDSDGNGPDGDDGTHATISSVSGKDRSISGREGEDKTPEQERDEEKDANAAAAAAAATAAENAAAASTETGGIGVEEGPAPGYEGPGGLGFDISFGPTVTDPNEEGRLPGDEYDPDRSFTKTTDSYGNLTGFVSDAGTKISTNPDTGELEIDTSGRMGPDGTRGGMTDLGYNDLVDLGYFDALDLDVEANARAKADQIEMDAMYNGLDVTVGVDKDGNFSYAGPDAFEVAMGQIGSGISAGVGALTDMAKGLTSVTPEGIVWGGLTGTGLGGSLTRSAIGEYEPILGGLFSGGKFKADPYTSPSMRAYAKELEDKAKKEGKTVAEVSAELSPDRIAELTSYGDYEGRRGQDLLSLTAAQDRRNELATADQERRDLGFVTPDAPNTTGLSSITNADLESYEGVRGPGSHAYEVGDPTYDPDRVDLGSITSADLAAAAKAAENVRATENQRMQDIVMGPDLSRATPSLGGRKQTEAERREQVQFDALGPKAVSATGPKAVSTVTGSKPETKQDSNTLSNFFSGLASIFRGPEDPQAALAAIRERDRAELDRIQRENTFNRSMGGIVKREESGTVKEAPTMTIKEYFDKQMTKPFYSTEPNQFLVELQRRIYPNLSTDEIYRRLGYRPAPDPDDTSTASYYNNPYGMNI